MHVALSRVVASSDVNCRFRTTRSMLRQQSRFHQLLSSTGLLQRCPYAAYAGAISQVPTVYNTSDVTGILVLDWVPSHLPLAALAFRALPPWADDARRRRPSEHDGQSEHEQSAKGRMPDAQALKLVRLSVPRPTGVDGAADRMASPAARARLQLARRVKASEVMVEAVSGYGVTPSSGRIQDLYASTLAFTPQPAPVWNFSSWIPDAVVILIGPNDERRRRLAAWPRLSRALVEGISPVTSADFVSAYLELCTLVATRYATAPVPPKLVHVCGGSINGLDPCEDIQTAIAAFNKEWRKSATRSHYASITVEHWNEINDPSHEFLGCDSHYGPKGHAVLAQDIAPQLEAIMGWS